MSPIHQIYCTHCTYGSSALEQREGELAERVLGYSARAGSLERHELRGYYRQVERFLYYYLPSDSPPEERLKLDAATAPRRMFYSPSIGRLQMLGQVVYRRYDTAERAGSYFAHVLFGEREAEPWPVLDCLRLWDAPWVVEDAPEHPKRLPALAGLDELLQGRPAAIDDGVLLSFLETPADQAFNDPRKVIPERWRAAPPDERAELLIDVAQGYIELGSNRRDSVLLVCEPSLAALVFYGVARLLPPGAVRADLSFSTYEPSPERLPVALAATTFHTPDTTDLKPEAYRRRGFVYNTYLDKRSDAGRPGGSYARLMVETLLAEGWPAVDALLEGFAEAGCGKLEELESLAQTHRLAPRLLDPAATLDSAVWARSSVAERYLGAAVERQLAAAEPNGPQLRALVGSPRQMLLAELAAARPGAVSSPSMQFLLRNVPPERLNELLSSQRIAWEAKVETLAFHLSSAGRFPDGCELLWAESAGAAKRAGAGRPPLLSAALARLSQPALVSLHETVPDGRGEAFVVALARACRIEPRRQAALERFLAEVVATLDEQRLVGLLSRCRTELQASYARPEPLLAHRLSKLLYALPDRPREFAERLEALSGWVDHFTEPGLAEQRLAQWRKLHSILQSLADGEAKKSGGLFKGKAKPDYKGLAEALKKAMPNAVYTDDLAGSVKKKRLRELGTHIVGSPDFLPPAVWNKITRYFEYGDWAEGAKTLLKPKGKGRLSKGKPLPKQGGKPKRPPQGGWFGRWIVLLAICLGSGLGLGYWAWRYLHLTSAVAENAQGSSGQKNDVRAASPHERNKTTPKQASPKSKRPADLDPTRKQTPRDKSKKPPKTKTHSADDQPTAQQQPMPSTKPVAEEQPPTDKPDGTSDEPPVETDPLPDKAEKPPDMPKAPQPPAPTESPESSDPGKTRHAPNSLGATPTSNSVPPDKPVAVEAPKTKSKPPPRAESVELPPVRKFTQSDLTKAVPASKHYEMDVFGPSHIPGTRPGEKFIIVVQAPGSMSLCRVAQDKPNDVAVQATPQNLLATFDVVPQRMSFKWQRPSDRVLRDCCNWFCENGFMLRLTTDQGPRYFALYKPEREKAVKIDSKSAAGPIVGIKRVVRERDLRLGTGKVHFADGTVREFDEASDGTTASLDAGGTGAAALSNYVQLERLETNDSVEWTMKVVTKESAKDPREFAADGPNPVYISGSLYRLVDLEGTKVRVDEVILDEPKVDPTRKVDR